MHDELRNELQKQQAGTILMEREWGLPVLQVQLEYELVEKSRMDLLMKMMLHTYSTLQNPTDEQLASLLFVDPLFIENLKAKMLHAHLLTWRDEVVSITNEGIQQLADGQFIELPEYESATFLFYGETGALFADCNKKMTDIEPYRYAKTELEEQFLKMEEATLLEAIRQLQVETVEETTQRVLTGNIRTISLETVYIPCYELQLQQQGTETVTIKVWNSLTSNWDEQLAQQIGQHEQEKNGTN